MWEGVLHMPPAPNYVHQRILNALIELLGPPLRTAGRGTLGSGINVFRGATGQEDYLPDVRPGQTRRG
jgi:hypothetical protein